MPGEARLQTHMNDAPPNCAEDVFCCFSPDPLRWRRASLSQLIVDTRGGGLVGQAHLQISGRMSGAGHANGCSSQCCGMAMPKRQAFSAASFSCQSRLQHARKLLFPYAVCIAGRHEQGLLPATCPQVGCKHGTEGLIRLFSPVRLSCWAA